MEGSFNTVIELPASTKNAENGFLTSVFEIKIYSGVYFK
jgi:hypothetical protein